MNQERSVKLMLLDLRVMQEDLDMDVTMTYEDRYNILKQSLESKLKLMWAVGYDARVKDYNRSQEKQVIQEDIHHKKIQSFDSMAQAYKKVGMSKSGMINAIRDKIFTRKGYYFKYAEADGADNN